MDNTLSFSPRHAAIDAYNEGAEDRLDHKPRRETQDYRYHLGYDDADDGIYMVSALR